MNTINNNLLKCFSILVLFGIFLSKTTEQEIVDKGVISTTTFQPIQETKGLFSIIKLRLRALKFLAEKYFDVLKLENGNVQDTFKDIYINATNQLSWYFEEPTRKETAELNRGLNKFYPFGGNETDYLDTIEKMDEFCSNRNKYIDTMRYWFFRRYPIAVQWLYTIFIVKINREMDHFCESSEAKSQYVKNMQKFKAVNNQLVEARNHFIDSAYFVKNVTYRVTKTGTLCCALWELIKRCKESLPDKESTHFIEEFNSYMFYAITNTMCVLYREGTKGCETLERAPRAPHFITSVILEMIVGASDTAKGSNPSGLWI